MGTTRVFHIGMVAVGITVLLTAWPTTWLSAQPAQPDAVQIDNDDIGGVVTSPRGPEAGVWVIAETTDLGTRFAKLRGHAMRAGATWCPTCRKPRTTSGCAATGSSIRRRSRPSLARSST